MAATYGQRPSAIFGIKNRRLAYWFDVSVMNIANTPEKPKTVYADPSAMITRKVVVKPDGTWD
jgi:hypothetical protein